MYFTATLLKSKSLINKLIPCSLIGSSHVKKPLHSSGPSFLLNLRFGLTTSFPNGVHTGTDRQSRMTPFRKLCRPCLIFLRWFFRRCNYRTGNVHCDPHANVLCEGLMVGQFRNCSGSLTNSPAYCFAFSSEPSNWLAGRNSFPLGGVAQESGRCMPWLVFDSAHHHCRYLLQDLEQGQNRPIYAAC